MKHLYAFVFAAALVALCVATGSAQQQDQKKPDPNATFTKMEVIFHTTDNDKDHDTRVEFYVIEYDGAPVRAYLDMGGNNSPHVPNQGFPDNTTSPTYSVPTFGPGFQLKDMGRMQIGIKQTPKGSDEWHYWIEAHLHFSDGTTVDYKSGVVKINGAHQTLFKLPAQP